MKESALVQNAEYNISDMVDSEESGRLSVTGAVANAVVNRNARSWLLTILEAVEARIEDQLDTREEAGLSIGGWKNKDGRMVIESFAITAIWL